jgi:hypothetical protein
MTIETVYLVEDHQSDSNRYWAHVYLSAARAKAGVEYWYQRSGVGRLRWEDGSFGVMIAYVDNHDTADRAYAIIPLRVHRDDQPEE